MQVLCLDSGSSSLKFAIYEMPSERLILSGIAEVSGADKQSAAVLSVLEKARQEGVRVDAIGHRVVIGGPQHVKPERVDAQLIASLGRLADLDPIHMEPALASLRSVAQNLPDTPAVACFDSAFFSDLPSIARRYPLPSSLGSMVRRYGYHGLSYEYIVSTLQPKGKTVIAHLGNGASLAAMRDTKPIETTMGFTPLGGMMMGTRPGDLDPGVLLYLLRAGGFELGTLTSLVYSGSGLLAVSGRTADMRELLQRAPNDPAAQEAIDLFVYTAVKHIAGLVAALGGLDTLVFTGGIGENAWQIRKAICNGFGYLGVIVDESRNESQASRISTKHSRVDVMVVATNENLMIARHVLAVIGSSG